MSRMRIIYGQYVLTWRPLHGKQPFRDFLCGLRVLALSIAESDAYHNRIIVGEGVLTAAGGLRQAKIEGGIWR